jgi:hypothetical protein
MALFMLLEMQSASPGKENNNKGTARTQDAKKVFGAALRRAV